MITGIHTDRHIHQSYQKVVDTTYSLILWHKKCFRVINQNNIKKTSIVHSQVENCSLQELAKEWTDVHMYKSDKKNFHFSGAPQADTE